MALDTLEQLLNATADLGGGPGSDNASAIAKLILGGGSASLEGTQLFGQPIQSGGLGPGRIYKNPLGGDPIDIQPTAPASLQPAKPLPNNLKAVLDTADQIASSLGSPNASGRAVEQQTMLPNPFGRGSYDPNNPEQVARVQGQRAEAEKLDKAKDILGRVGNNPLLAKNQGDIAKFVLQSLGVVPTAEKEAFDRAKGAAEGAIAGGKGVKTAIDPALVRAVGSKEFDEKLSEAVATGKLSDPQQQLALERLHESKLKRTTVGDVDRRSLTDLRGSHSILGELADAYDQTPAAKTGKVSDSLRLALNTNSKIAAISEAQLIDGSKLEPSERKFVARYNSLLMSLRRLSGDPRFSDTDALRALTALGNPSVGRDLYREQISALRDEIATRYETARQDLSSVGKNTADLPSLSSAQPAAQAVPKNAPAGAKPTNRTAGGKPVFQLPNGKYWVAD